MTRALREPPGKKRRVEEGAKEVRTGRSVLGYRGDCAEECRTLKGKNKAGNRVMRVFACHLCKYYPSRFNALNSPEQNGQRSVLQSAIGGLKWP